MENFRAWFDRNFVNARAGRIGHVSYARAGELDDHRNDPLWYTFAYERAIIDHTEPLQADELAFLLKNPLIMFQLTLGVTDLRGLRCLRRGLTKSINNLQAKSYRARYYSRDNARRRLLAAERRRITRRRTNNPCPTAATFREAFAHRADSIDARIYFGGLVHDLECYVDNCLRINKTGEILGRNGGVKAWIADNVPELYCHYKVIMRYKALAKRIRQAADIKDPIPTDVLLPLVDHETRPPTEDGKKRVSEHETLSTVTCGNPNKSEDTPRAMARICKAMTGNATGKAQRRNGIYYAVKSYTVNEHVAVDKVKMGGTCWNEAWDRVATTLKDCPNTLKELFERLE